MAHRLMAATAAAPEPLLFGGGISVP